MSAGPTNIGPVAPYTIEFLGLPASGKTRLARVVHAELRRSGSKSLTLGEAVLRGLERGVDDKLIDRLVAAMPRRTRRRLADGAFIRSTAFLRSLVGFGVDYPGAVSSFLSAQTRRADREVGRDLILNWFLQLVARYRFASEVVEDDEVLVLDEGFVQRVLTGFAVRFSGEDHSDVETYLESIPRPGLLVLFTPDLEVVTERLGRAAQGGDPTGRRSIYGTKRLSESGMEPRQFLEDCSEVVSFVTRQARAMGWPMVEVSPATPVAEAASAVLERVSPPGQGPSTGRA